MRKLFSAKTTLLTFFVAAICLLFAFTLPASARVSEQIEQLSVKSIGPMWPNRTVPASGIPGFEPGAELYLKNATTFGKSYKCVTVDTKISYLFTITITGSADPANAPAIIVNVRPSGITANRNRTLSLQGHGWLSPKTPRRCRTPLPVFSLAISPLLRS